MSAEEDPIECPFCEDGVPTLVQEDFRTSIVDQAGKEIVVGVRGFRCPSCDHSWLPAEEEAKIDAEIEKRRSPLHDGVETLSNGKICVILGELRRASTQLLGWEQNCHLMEYLRPLCLEVLSLRKAAKATAEVCKLAKEVCEAYKDKDVDISIWGLEAALGCLEETKKGEKA